MRLRVLVSVLLLSAVYGMTNATAEEDPAQRSALIETLPVASISLEPIDEDGAVHTPRGAATITGLSLCPRREVVAATVWDGSVVVVGVQDMSFTAPYTLRPSGSGSCLASAFSYDGTTLLASRGDTVSAIDLKSRSEHWSVRTNARPVSAMVLSPDGIRLATGGWSGPVQFIDVSTGRLHSSDLRPGVEVYSMSFDGGGHFLMLGCADGRVLVCSVREGKVVKTLNWDTIQVAGLVSNADGDVLLAGSRNLSFVDTRSGAAVLSVGRGRLGVSAMTTLPTRAFTFVGYRDGLLEMVESASGGVVFSVNVGDEVRGLAVSPDMRWVLVATGGKLSLWSIQECLRNAETVLEIRDPGTYDDAWESLGSCDATRAFSIRRWLLATHKSTCDYLTDRVKRACSSDERLRELRAQVLGSDAEAAQRALMELDRCGSRGRSVLASLLEERIAASTRDAVVQLLEVQDAYGLAGRPSLLRGVRLIEVLESIGSEGAESILVELSRGPTDSSESRMATAALKRLGDLAPGDAGPANESKGLQDTDNDK